MFADRIVVVNGTANFTRYPYEWQGVTPGPLIIPYGLDQCWGIKHPNGTAGDAYPIMPNNIEGGECIQFYTSTDNISNRIADQLVLNQHLLFASFFVIFSNGEKEGEKGERGLRERKRGNIPHGNRGRPRREIPLRREE